jgi:hypothetical protein
VSAIVSSFAVTEVLPSPIAVSVPDGLTVAKVMFDEDYRTATVSSSMLPSDIVASALSCDVSPFKLKLVLPSIWRDTTVELGAVM